MGDLALPFVLPRINDPELEVLKFINFLQALEDRRRRALRPSALPIDLTIDFTTTCQLSCPYCAVGNGTMQRKSSLMSEPLYHQIVDELSETTFITWYFSTGEPLLHKRFSELMEYEKGKDVFSSISTNLSLPLSDDKIDALLICGLKQISVSLDGASPETYATYRVGGRFDLVLTNMVRLVKRKAELGLAFPLIEWRFLLFEHNGHEIEAATQMAREIGVDLLEFFPGYAPLDGPVLPFRGTYSQNPVVGPAFDLGRTRCETPLQKHLADRSPWPAASPDPSTLPRKCDWHYLGSMIYPDGAVGPCCVSVDEKDDFGRIDEQVPFQSTFNNDQYLAARRSFVTGKASNSICDVCPTPIAQHQQFTQKLRALLRIAPDWALTILESDFNRFFYRSDLWLLPNEAGTLAEKSLIMDRNLDPLIDWQNSAAAVSHPRTQIQASRYIAMNEH